MRTDIVHSGADELVYEIRGVAAAAEVIAREGKRVIWENIGDPIAKGHRVPEWIKDLVAAKLRQDRVFGYSPTRGLDRTREFIVEQRRREGGAALSKDDILFFNGLGDAISIIYTYLNPAARVIGPSPAYPTHSSAEASHGNSPHITYSLNPDRDWLPDMENLRNHIKYNPTIAGILIINPDNPTGMVYPREILKQMVDLAREFDLFLISDEVYANISYGREPFVPLSQVIEDVPAIVMRGISKEMPWPGARCGWVEFYNTDRDESFARYIRSIFDAKALQVCATTLPQAVLPDIYAHPEWPEHLRRQSLFYARRARRAVEIFSASDSVKVVLPQGGFYLSVVFAEAKASSPFAAAIAAKGEQLDRKFTDYLLKKEGICVVPLSGGFNSEHFGFRMTLLEKDDRKFQDICRRTVSAVERFFLDLEKRK